MDKKIVGVIGAMSAVTSVSGAQASMADVVQLMKPQSFAELLEPIPNAVALLRAADRAPANAALAKQKTSGNANVTVAQNYPDYYPYYHHHHHHHHHDYYQPYHHHHHHNYDGYDGAPE